MGNFHPKDPESPDSKRLEYNVDPYDKNYPVRKKRHLRITEEEDFDVRLCQANVNGTICPEGARQGFVELFNRTTMQWVPMCDKRFSERNAEVVCRQLGFSNLNVFLDFDRRIEYHDCYKPDRQFDQFSIPQLAAHSAASKIYHIIMLSDFIV